MVNSQASQSQCSEQSLPSGSYWQFLYIYKSNVVLNNIDLIDKEHTTLFNSTERNTNKY